MMPRDNCFTLILSVIEKNQESLCKMCIKGDIMLGPKVEQKKFIDKNPLSTDSPINVV